MAEGGDEQDPALTGAARRCAEAGLLLMGPGDEGAASTPQGRGAQLAGAIVALAEGGAAACERGGVRVLVSARDAAELDAFRVGFPRAVEAARRNPSFQSLPGAGGEDLAGEVMKRLGAIPEGDVASHVAVLVALADKAARQAGYQGLASDYDALLAKRDEAVPLEDSAAEYGRLLERLASAGQAVEAAPTYTLLREGLVQGRFGAATFDELVLRFTKALLAAGDADDARESLTRASDSAEVLVEEGGDTVSIGSVRLPIRG